LYTLSLHALTTLPYYYYYYYYSYQQNGTTTNCGHVSSQLTWEAPSDVVLHPSVFLRTSCLATSHSPPTSLHTYNLTASVLIHIIIHTHATHTHTHTHWPRFFRHLAGSHAWIIQLPL